MEILDRTQVIGSNVEMNTSYQNHISDEEVASESDDPVEPFADVIFNAVDQVNELQGDSADLQEQLMINPEEVNIHEVMISMEKARLSVSFMKSLTETALKAYNEIMMIR